MHPAETTAEQNRFARYDENTTTHTLAIITDEDHASQVELEDGQVAWQSTVRYHRLHRRTDDHGRPRFEIEEIPSDEGGTNRLISLVAESGKGAEFSELCLFGERLLAFDDRTGLICGVREEHRLIPRQIPMTGSGDEAFKGFKSEWATIKGDRMLVGSHGKNARESWIKAVDRDYRVTSWNWNRPYTRMCEALGIDPACGYVIHEAGEWHPEYQQRCFFPRKISTRPFDEPIDERERGGNMLIIADEAFENIRTLPVGERVPERGCSPFKGIPGRPDECVGLKSVEIGDKQETYLFCFDLDGNILQDDTFLGAYNCEGVEIL